MTITIGSQGGQTRSWTLPYALLKEHSGYFRKMEKFKEGQEGSVDLKDQDASIFAYFVELFYFGDYTLSEDSVDANGVRDDAKAWVLGDYLDATSFKNRALRNSTRLTSQKAKSAVRRSMRQ